MTVTVLFSLYRATPVSLTPLRRPSVPPAFMPERSTRVEQRLLNAVNYPHAVGAVAMSSELLSAPPLGSHAVGAAALQPSAPFSAPPLGSHAGGAMALSLELDICLILRLSVMPSAPLTPLALSCAPRAPHTLPHTITYTTLWPLPLLSLFALYRPPAPLSPFALFRATRASVSV